MTSLKEESHLVTINPRIGIKFVHVLTGKKNEVSDLPKFLETKLQEAMKQPGFSADNGDKLKGLRVLGSFDGEMIGTMNVLKKNGQGTAAVALGQLRKSLKKAPTRLTEALLISTADGLR